MIGLRCTDRVRARSEHGQGPSNDDTAACVSASTFRISRRRRPSIRACRVEPICCGGTHHPRATVVLLDLSGPGHRGGNRWQQPCSGIRLVQTCNGADRPHQACPEHPAAGPCEAPPHSAGPDAAVTRSTCCALRGWWVHARDWARAYGRGRWPAERILSALAPSIASAVGVGRHNPEI